MKKLLIVLAFAAVSVATYAQNEPAEKYSVATNSFWSNWFIELGADWNAWYTDQEHGTGNNISPLKDFRATYGVGVAVGKWFTPGLGLRTKVQGIWGKAPMKNEQTNEYKYWTAQEHVLFNLSNMICGYNPNRTWNFIPFLGAGIVRDMTEDQYGMAFAAGIKNTFRLSNRVLLNLELGYNWMEEDVDTYKATTKQGRPWECRDNKFYAELGLTFNLGTATWEKTPDVDAIRALYQSQIDALNAQLNAANAEIARLKNLLANQKPAETVVVKEVFSAPVSVFYNINNGTEINSERDLVNVEAFAKAAADKDVKVLVTGYADSATGTDEINNALAEQRAQTLADKLVEFGVNRDNISTVSKGGVDTLSPVAYNRRATAEAK